ncbi:MAG TPA: glycosyltransferase [bacterium]|nr:glycosyltransferase [bacterium]
MNPEIIIILPVHNRRETTRKFLECLIGQTFQHYHLILIDDGCIDGTPEMSESLIKNITILKGNGNLWWAGSLHLAYKHLKETHRFQDDDIVLIINDDVFIKPDFLSIAAELFKQNNGRKILSQAIAIDKSTGKELPGVFYDNKAISFEPTKHIDRVNCMSTRGLLLRKSDFTDSGGFHPCILRHYLSDYEFTNRLISKRNFIPVMEERFVLEFFPETSGFENPTNKDKICNYLSDLFSKKNKSNPIHWIVFIFLTTQFPYNFKNVLKIIYLNVRQTAVVLKRSIDK